MPFGFSKKDKDQDLDSQKNALFGKSSKGKSSANSAASNPYAVPPPANDPYAPKPSNPYAAQNGRSDPYAAQSQPPTGSFGNMSLNDRGAPPPAYGGQQAPGRNEKSPVPPGGYGGGGSRYQSQGNYGQGGGYGSDPYGSNSQGGSSGRHGGYGGMGRNDSQDTMATDAGRNALFGDAAQRAQKQQQQPPQQSSNPYGQRQDSSYSNSGGYDSAEMPGGYGAAPDRELTAEEQEEQDVHAAKDEIRFIKQQDVASTRNALRIAQQAEETGRDTLARLGAQGERIHNTEYNLDRASNHNALAREKADELKTLNRSMFAVHVANPFTKRQREDAANQLALEKNQSQRRITEATRKEAYDTYSRQQAGARDLNKGVGPGKNKVNLAERSKYQFEADSEDEAMENEIDENLDGIMRGAKMLNKLGRAMGDEIDSQNKHLDRITRKTDKVDDEIAVNRARLDRIK